LWLHSLKVAQLLRSAACLHTNQSLSYLNDLVCCLLDDVVIKEIRSKPNELGKDVVHVHFDIQFMPLTISVRYVRLLRDAGGVYRIER
jgi:hypothetical protein